MSKHALTISSLHKSYESKEVLRGVSLDVPERCIFGLIGKNGAGKTTLMKSVLGLLPFSAGNIKIYDTNITYGQALPANLVGYLPDVPEFYNYMTAKEYLRLCGEIARIPKNLLNSRIQELLKLVGLVEVKQRIKGYSRGMKQRLGVAQALITHPRLLICDEPTSALDPVGRKEILDILRRAKGETTIIFSTHILSNVERICDRVGLLEGGVIALSGTIEELKAMHTTSDLEIVLDNSDDCTALIRQFPNGEKDKNKVILHEITPDHALNVLRYITDEKLHVLKYELLEPTLEDLFMEVIQT